jgi:hypothetical protein
MLDRIQARDLSIGDEVPNGVVSDITTGPTGLLSIEIEAYPGSIITNTVTLSPVSWVEVL